MARADFTEDALVDPDHTADEPVTLRVVVSKIDQGRDGAQLLTQKTPIVLKEQYGGRSGWIMQNMPCNCQLMKNTMNRWWVYQNHSKCARRRFSIANHTMMPRAAVMIQPVRPGPVAKLATKNATTRWPVVFASVSMMASFAKLTMCAPMCTADQKTMDQAVALWKVMFLSKGMKWFNGVRRTSEMKFRQTGSRMKMTSTWRTRAAVRAMAVGRLTVGNKRNVSGAY